MTNIQALHEQMDKAGLPNEIWQNAGKNRIYFTKLPSDIIAYIEFDQVYFSALSDAWKEYQNYWVMYPYDDVFHGCKLHVFTNVFVHPDWHDNNLRFVWRNWIVDRRKKMMHSLMNDLQKGASSGIINSAMLTKPVCKHWQDVILSDTNKEIH